MQNAKFKDLPQGARTILSNVSAKINTPLSSAMPMTAPLDRGEKEGYRIQGFGFRLSSIVLRWGGNDIRRDFAPLLPLRALREILSWIPPVSSMGQAQSSWE